MAVVLVASGTLTTNPGTEQTVHSVAADGVFLFVFDRAARQAGEDIEARVKTKVLGPGTVRTLYYDLFEDAPVGDGDFICQSHPLSTDVGAEFSIEQTGGSARSIPWKVLQI